MAMVAVYKFYTNADIVKYFLNASLGIYFIIFIIKYSYITQYNLDFYGIAIVGFLELIFLFPKLASFCKNEDEEHN